MQNKYDSGMLVFAGIRSKCEPGGCKQEVNGDVRASRKQLNYMGHEARLVIQQTNSQLVRLICFIFSNSMLCFSCMTVYLIKPSVKVHSITLFKKKKRYQPSQNKYMMHVFIGPLSHQHDQSLPEILIFVNILL